MKIKTKQKKMMLKRIQKLKNEREEIEKMLAEIIEQLFEIE